MNVRLIDLPFISENDGCLTYFEGNKEIPFEIKRCFYIFDVPTGKQRADHASVTTDFVLIAVNGSVEVELDDGRIKTEYALKDKLHGLFVPKGTWMKTKSFLDDAVLLVLASTDYKECKYIDNYQEFKYKVQHGSVEIGG